MRIVTRGSKIGVCNICGEHGPLTEDHIPPKGVLRPKQVEIMTLTDMLTVPRPTKSSRFSQDGVKYRTLCATCNNFRLGQCYDPALICLTDGIKAFVARQSAMPTAALCEVKANRVVRSIVGHLLAHGIGEHRTGTGIDALTDFFLDEALPFPKNIKLYYWLYPYSDQVILKGFGYSEYLWNSFATCLLLKFFPFSFFFVIDEPDSWRLPLDRLDTLLTERIDEDVEFRLQFHGLPPQRWPETPTEIGIAMHTPGATGAIPRAT